MTLAHLAESLLQIFGERLQRAGHRLHHQRLEESFVKLRIVDDLLHVGVDLDDDSRGVPAGANRPNDTLAS